MTESSHEEQKQEETQEQEPNNRLNAKQINFARERIEELRILENTPIEIVWPFLHYICCCLTKRRKIPFMVGLKRSLRRKLELTLPDSDLRLLNDPYLRLGYGMHSYFQVLQQLMCMMGLIMVLSVPLMLTYASFDDLKYASGDYAWNQYSLGNMGGAEAIC